MKDTILKILKDTSHEPNCEYHNLYHNYGCSFDGDKVGDEINVFPGNLVCTCTPSGCDCTCKHREERQAELIVNFIEDYTGLYRSSLI